jgi:hypothetical protein
MASPGDIDASPLLEQGGKVLMIDMGEHISEPVCPAIAVEVPAARLEDDGSFPA